MYSSSGHARKRATAAGEFTVATAFPLSENKCVVLGDRWGPRVRSVLTAICGAPSRAQPRQGGEVTGIDASVLSRGRGVRRRGQLVGSLVPPVGWHNIECDRPGFILEANRDAGHRQKVVDEPVVAVAASR